MEPQGLSAAMVNADSFSGRQIHRRPRSRVAFACTGPTVLGRAGADSLPQPDEVPKPSSIRVREQRCFPSGARYIGRAFADPSFRRAAGASALFITSAFAQVSGASPLSTDTLVQFAPFVVIFAIMYFLILRPQQQKVKQHQSMIKALRRGDTVVTNGGLVAKVTKVVDDDQIEVEIADGVRVRQMRSMVTEVRAKGEPVKDDAS